MSVERKLYSSGHPAPTKNMIEPPISSSSRHHIEEGTKSPLPGLKTLRSSIPAHCFQPSLLKSMQYVVRDICLMVALFYVGLKLPLITDHPGLRVMCWTAYGFLQGLVFTGLWILAHECGHDSFSVYPNVNAAVGFVIHSVILVPFFSWKYSHSRHHRFANHMDKDTVFVPSKKSEYRTTFWTGKFLGHGEDAPLVNLLLLLGHQLLGWPTYIMFNAGAGTKSLIKRDRSGSSRQSHLDPGADLFHPREHPYILLSNMGLIAVLVGLWTVSRSIGVRQTCLLYGLPYLWMNHWLVAITYLHHTHPDMPHYDDTSWNFQSGALSTIDRDFGFVGRHMFHGIIEYHVIHHMFPRIPFYHAEEATEAITPLLGKAYMRIQTSFLWDLWLTFDACRFVEESRTKKGLMYWSKK